MNVLSYFTPLQKQSEQSSYFGKWRQRYCMKKKCFNCLSKPIAVLWASFIVGPNSHKRTGTQVGCRVHQSKYITDLWVSTYRVMRNLSFCISSSTEMMKAWKSKDLKILSFKRTLAWSICIQWNHFSFPFSISATLNHTVQYMACWLRRKKIIIMKVIFQM